MKKKIIILYKVLPQKKNVFSKTTSILQTNTTNKTRKLLNYLNNHYYYIISRC